jgi:hypothetical protein
MASTARSIRATSSLQECKAWVNFRGNSTVIILASTNVTSVTDNGTGDYTANWTTPFASTSYCVPLALQGVTTDSLIVNEDFSNAKTVSAFRVRTRIEDSSFTDAQKVYLIAYGEQ